MSNGEAGSCSIDVSAFVLPGMERGSKMRLSDVIEDWHDQPIRHLDTSPV